MLKAVNAKRLALLFAFLLSLPSVDAEYKCTFLPSSDLFSCTKGKKGSKGLSVKIFNLTYEVQDFIYNEKGLNLLSISSSILDPTGVTTNEPLRRSWEVVVYPRKDHKQILTTPYPLQQDISQLNKFYSSDLGAKTDVSPPGTTDNKSHFTKLILPKVGESIRGSLVLHSQIEHVLARVTEALKAAPNNQNSDDHSLLVEGINSAPTLTLQESNFDGVSPFPVPQFDVPKPSVVNKIKGIFESKEKSFILREEIKTENGDTKFTSFSRALPMSNKDPRYVVQYQTLNANGAETGMCIELDYYIHYCTDPKNSSKDEILLVPNKSVKVKLLTMEERRKQKKKFKIFSSSSTKQMLEPERFLYKHLEEDIRRTMKRMSWRQEKEKRILQDLIFFEKSEFVMALRLLPLQKMFSGRILDKYLVYISVFYREIQDIFASTVKRVLSLFDPNNGSDLKGEKAGMISDRPRKNKRGKNGYQAEDFQSLLQCITDMHTEFAESFENLNTSLEYSFKKVNIAFHSQKPIDNQDEFVSHLAALTRQVGTAMNADKKAFEEIYQN